MKKLTLLLALILAGIHLHAQNDSIQLPNDELSIGLRLQKTQRLYWENGISMDYTADFLWKRHIHFKLSYVSSGLGSAIGTNALVQDNIIAGADIRIHTWKGIQLLAGANTGYFHVNLPSPMFDELPHNSYLLSGEIGLAYRMKTLPFAATLTTGYNFRNGNGVDIPGSLFPVFYQLSLFYCIGGNLR